MDETLTCYYCQKRGHQRSECRKLKLDRKKGIHADSSNSTKPAVASATDTVSHSIFTAFSSSSVSTGHAQWLLDSRCSTHVAGMKDHFSSYIPVAAGEQKIHIANNVEIDALGEGEVTLSV